MDDVFESLYSSVGRASIPPEQLLRALLLQILYSIRSERQMVERLSYDMLFRWFVGLSLDDQVWHATTFTHNRDRLITSGIVNQAFTDNGLLAMSFSAKFDLSSLAYSLMSDGEKDQVNAWRRSATL